MFHSFVRSFRSFLSFTIIPFGITQSHFFHSNTHSYPLHDSLSPLFLSLAISLAPSLSLPFPYANQKERSVALFNCGFLVPLGHRNTTAFVITIQKCFPRCQIFIENHFLQIEVGRAVINEGILRRLGRSWCHAVDEEINVLDAFFAFCFGRRVDGYFFILESVTCPADIECPRTIND